MREPAGIRLPRQPRQPRVSWALRLVVAVSTAATTAAAIAHPYADPLPQPHGFQPAYVAVQDLLLAKRADSCPASFSTCSDLEATATFAAICCSTSFVCATDVAGSPACCPSGDVCTGTVPTETSHPATTAVSFVSNPYFPFPFAPTYFANHGDCSAAVSECVANYVACTSNLEGQGLSAATANGGTFGVTVVVPGGTTVIGGGAAVSTLGGTATITGTITTYPTAKATSICRSLSSEASCGSLSMSLCTLSATTVSGFGFGNAALPAARATPFGKAGMVGLVAAGLAGLGAL